MARIRRTIRKRTTARERARREVNARRRVRRRTLTSRVYYFIIILVVGTFGLINVILI